MKRKEFNSKRWWLVPLILLLCFIGGSSPTWASTSNFATSSFTKVISGPSLARPCFTVQLLFYDADSYDSFFCHNAIEGNNKGPAVYVDGKYICSPDYELAWSGSSSNDGGDGNGANCYEDCRDYNEWWGNGYSKTIDGITYTVKFWNPVCNDTSDKTSGQRYVQMLVFISKMQVYSDHTIEVKGRWKTNKGSIDTRTVTFSTQATDSRLKLPTMGTLGVGSPTAVMTGYGKMKISGNLKSDYGPTTVGTNSGATTSGLTWTDDLTSHSNPYSQGLSSFSGLELDFDERDNYWDSQSKYVEYIVTDKVTIANKTMPEVKFYQWYIVNVPGYVRAKELEPVYDKWNKTITIKWKVDDSDSRCKEGSWSVYRGSTLLKSGISYDTQYYDDNSSDLAYDTDYTYSVCFVPDNTPNGVNPIEEFSELTQSKTGVNLKRDFSFSQLAATDSYENKIIFSWAHKAIGNASPQNPYELVVERSTDKKNWKEMTPSIRITDNEQTTGSYEDNKDLESFVTYFYRLKITVLGTKYYSDQVSGSLDGMSKVTSFSASRGTYTNVVKLRWDVRQVGSTITYFTIYRRPLGSNSESDWGELATLSGTSASYTYDDETAQIGSFNQYKVAVWTMFEGEKRLGKETETDGFCLSSGLISGHITYGTGVAVEGAKVTLKQQSSSGETTSGMHSVKFSGPNSGLVYKSDSATVDKLFGGDFSVQMYLNPDNNATDGMNGHTAHYQLFNCRGVFEVQLKYYTSFGETHNQPCYMVIIYGPNRMDADQILLPANEWSHLTVVYKRNDHKATVYVTKNDSVISQELTGLNADLSGLTTTNIGITRHGDFSASSRTYRGYMDEFRFFNKALTKDDILRYYNHPLAGNEPGLAIYYPFDEGISAQALAYDFSKTNGVANGRHATTSDGDIIGTAASGTTKVPNEKQLSLMAYTDSIGDYIISGVPFSGEGINYSVVPTLGIHEFSPARQSRFVSINSLIHSGVDFEDVSSFPVSGKVFYAGTTYPVEGVNFYVDGAICAKDGKVIETNENGEYEISVPIGDHFIEARKNGHVFTDAGRYPADPNNTGERKTFDEEKKNMDFYDETLVNFTGRIVGGSIEGDKTVGFGLSKNNIGVTELVLTPLNDQYMMNAAKIVSGTTYEYLPDSVTKPIESATEKINSTSWRGAGDDDCNKLIIHTDSVTGEFSAMVPPLQYRTSTMNVVATGLKVGESTTVDLTQPLINFKDSTEVDGKYEYYEYNTMLKQTFHNKPTFTVTQADHNDGAFGIKSYEVIDAEGTIQLNTSDIYNVDENGNVTYKYPGALFVMGDTYTFKLEGYEEYANSDADKDNPVLSKVPLAGSVVTISNALSSAQSVYIEGNAAGAEPGSICEMQDNHLELDSLGCATYMWKVGYPNIAYPYTRTITMTYHIDGRNYEWEGGPLKGVVLGALPTGNNFVTAGPDMLDMILRDPPGSKSKAEWTTGTIKTNSHSRGGVWNSQTHIKTTSKLGAEIDTGIGIGVVKLEALETKTDMTIGVQVNVEGEDAKTWGKTTTTTKAISTSDAMEYVGDQGDLFIGTSTNLIYGLSRNIDLTRVDGTNDVDLTLSDGITTGLDFETQFAYTKNYVENVLIPNFVKMRNEKLLWVSDTTSYKLTGNKAVYITQLTPDDPKYGTSNHKKEIWGSRATDDPCDTGPSYMMVKPEGWQGKDSVEWCNNQIDIWLGHLETNEREKVEAHKLSLQNKVKTTNVSFDSGSNVTYTCETDTVHGSTYECTVTSIATINFEAGCSINKTGVYWDVGTETGGGEHFQDSEDTHETASFSYTLAEEGDDDAISVDVYEYGSFGPIFRTRGGQTSAPYEGRVVTKYHEPGTTIMEATMQIEVPQIDVDEPTMTDIPTGSTANYTLRLSNASEIDEDVYYRLLVPDETNPNGAILSIDGKVITDSRIIKIPAGETISKALQLKQSDVSILEYDSIAVVLASQSQSDPTSTWEVISDTVYVSAYFVPSSSPVDLALSDRTINTQTGTNLTLSFSNFDRNYKGLKAFRLQFKKPGETDWTLRQEYVLSEDNLTSNNELLPTTGSSVSYVLPMETFPDGNYLFRCVSVATYGLEEVYRYSEEMPLVKDTQRPTSLGIPEPSDGILDVGDEISLTFNEAIVKGELNKERNFKVTGVLNGSEIAHETALSMQNTATTAQTEANITLANKDFSFDMWVNIQGAGTILTHGAGANKLTVGTDADGKMVVNIAGQTYTSSNTIPMGKWSFLTLNYLNTDTGGTLTASVASDANTTDLFNETVVDKYEGVGPLAVGANLTGAIHELLLWDEAHDLTTALLNRSKTKNPATRHLIGYWKMDEGEGTSIRDYARNRHMTMPDETWYLNNENKAVELDGSHYVTINTSQLNVFEGDDYALEFWVRGDKQTGEAQLAQVGDVALWLNADGQLQLTGKGAYLAAEEMTTFATTSGNILDNAWHHVALNILRQGATAVYVDGNRVLTTNASSVGSIASNSLIIGAKRTTFSAESGDYSFDRIFKGEIDEVRVWNASMNADMLTKNRKVRLTGKEDGLAAYYPFETKTLDSSNQVVTYGVPDDLCGSGLSAQLSTLTSQNEVFNYTDDAPALRTKPTETNVSFTYTANDTKVVIDIDEDPATIEGCTLNFTVRSVRDGNGNYTEPTIWSAFVNRNELVWKNDLLSLEQPVESSGSVTATIVNNGGKMQMWTLSGMPSWLKASAEYGSTNPLEETNVTFTVSESTPIGKYEETIYLSGNDGIETPLTISVKVTGEEPLWSVNPKDYELSMNLIGSLDFMGKPSQDIDDIVGVFIGDECRGVAHPEYRKSYDSYFVTMDIYGNSEDENKPLTFKAFDASTGTIYPVVHTSLNGAPIDISFVRNDLQGRYAQPVIISASDEVEQSIELAKGWNWMSLGVRPDDSSVSAIFQQNAGKLNLVKSNENYAEYDGDEWIGLLKEMNNKEMYLVQANEEVTNKLSGHPVDATQTPISLNNGWNWIGYHRLQTMSLGDALADWEPQDDDIIKGQRGVAYFDSNEGEWVGNLRALVPGQGYMAKSNNSQALTFRYPTSAVRSSNASYIKRYEKELSFDAVDYHNYPFNMVIFAQVVSGGLPLPDVEVGIFAGNECREAAYTDSRGMIYVTVPGEKAVKLTFLVSDGEDTYEASESVTYETDAVCGTPKSPFIINLDKATSIASINAFSDKESVYDLSGRKIVIRKSEGEKLRKGIYIVNGRKVVLK